TRIKRGFQRGWECRIKNAFLTQWDFFPDPSQWIDHRRDAVVRSANKRQPFFHSTKTCLRKMLVGARRHSEPGVVRHVQHPVGTRAFRHHGAGKNRLVADERRCWRQARNLQWPQFRTRSKSAALLRERLQAKAFKKIL